MSSLTSAFSFYAAYHSNPVNQLIHVVFVPAIYTTALAFLTRVPAGGLPLMLRSTLRLLGESAAAGSGASAPISLALPAAALYAGYYLSLSLPRRPLLGLSAGALALGALPLAHGLLALSPRAMPILIGVHVASWVAQFYGHGVHEGRSPALLDNLWQALVMAPMFVYIEVLFYLGLLGDLKREVDPVVKKALEEYREAKAAAAKK